MKTIKALLKMVVLVSLLSMLAYGCVLSELVYRVLLEFPHVSLVLGAVYLAYLPLVVHRVMVKSSEDYKLQLSKALTQTVVSTVLLVILCVYLGPNASFPKLAKIGTLPTFLNNELGLPVGAQMAVYVIMAGVACLAVSALVSTAKTQYSELSALYRMAFQAKAKAPKEDEIQTTPKLDGANVEFMDGVPVTRNTIRIKGFHGNC